MDAASDSAKEDQKDGDMGEYGKGEETGDSRYKGTSEDTRYMMRGGETGKKGNRGSKRRL